MLVGSLLLKRKYRNDFSLETSSKNRLNEGGVKIGYVNADVNIEINEISEMLLISPISIEVLQRINIVINKRSKEIPKPYERGLFAAKGIINRYECNNKI